MKSRLRSIFERLACPYSVENEEGKRKCAGYQDDSFTCTDPLAHRGYCGTYRMLKGDVRHE